MMDNRGGRSLGRTVLAGLAGLIVVALLAGEAWARHATPAAPAAGDAAAAVVPSDEAVKEAIKKGAEFLWKLQKEDGSWHLWKAEGMEDGFKDYIDGPTALVAYALMESGVRPTDKKMEKALTWLRKVNAKDAKGAYLTKGYIPKTYCMGLRCQAWLSAIRQRALEYRKPLQQDYKQLVLSTSDGSYGYDSTGKPAAGDHSNSQYGVLGVWAAALADMEVPIAYWRKVKAHWEAAQCNDGGWEYGGKAAVGKPTMAAAGVATLFVCFDNLYGEAFAGCTPSKEGRNARIPIQRGLDWFDQKYAGTIGAIDSYYLYGVERIGLASGYKYFGTTDWYKEGVKLLLKNQAANGSWKSSSFGDGAVATAQCMLFLIRGRQPVIFSKLKYDGDWDNRPRDLAMLTRWMMSEIFENEAFWQIVNMKIPPSDWHDAPAMVIAGSKAPTFGKDDLDKLRTYVNQGGAIFSITECDGTAFDRGMRETYAKLFPDYEIKEAPLTHELYSIHQDIRRAGLKFYILSNGVRPLAIHVMRDLTVSWQTYKTSGDKPAFQAGLNVYLYLTDKTFPPRGSRTWPAPAGEKVEDTVKLARIKFNGNWDPEPLAYQRFGRLLLENTGVKIESDAVTIDALPASGAKVAVLTGTGELSLSEAEAKTLRDFVDGGGTLVVDAAGGERKFGESAWKALGQPKAFPSGTMAKMKGADPLFSVFDERIESFRYRKRTAVRMRSGETALWASSAGEGRVIFSYEDITAALVNFPSHACEGYDPETAYAIMRNVVLSKLPGAASTESKPAAQKAEGE
ncbi:MAG: DUF4159 domain-containing protein [Planctomycetota bacterium]|nr:DUF4159 domain-containing protein [Planctomycetota bacterium]